MGYEETEEKLSRIMARMLNDPKIQKADRKALEAHISFMRAKGANVRTIIKHLYCLEKFITALGGSTTLRKAKKRDVEKAVAKMEQLGLAQDTKHHIKAVIKAFYKHMLGDDLYYPMNVAWLKTSSGRGMSQKLLPEDILSEEEILRLIEAAKNLRDKTMIALLFDSGIRMGELMGMKIKDVDMAKEPAHIVVSGKTGMRRIPILFSVPYLAQYLNTLKGKKPGEHLWNVIGTWANYDKVADYAAIRKMLQNAAEAAGIQKRIYPHLFRHSRASYYANKLTEQQLKVFFGWTGDSRMASTYVHLSGRDIDNAILQAHGIKPPERMEESKLKVQVCPRCKFPNTVEATYCIRCGCALDIKTAMETVSKEKDLKEAVVESINDKKTIEEIVHRYLLEQRKKGKSGKK